MCSVKALNSAVLILLFMSHVAFIYVGKSAFHTTRHYSDRVLREVLSDRSQFDMYYRRRVAEDVFFVFVCFFGKIGACLIFF